MSEVHTTPLVVLSMPRSGTSLLASILGAMGATLSDDLTDRLLSAPHELNPDGFFESAALLTIRCGVEEALGINFSFPASWSEPDWPQSWSSGIEALCEQGMAYFQRYMEQGVERLVFKDPRTTALLPFWTKVFDRLGLRPRYIVAVRHPVSFMRSVKGLANLSPRMAELIWIEGFVTALEFVRRQEFTLVHYERWFDDERQAGELYQALFGGNIPDAMSDHIRRTIIKTALNRNTPSALSGDEICSLAQELHQWSQTIPVACHKISSWRPIERARSFLNDIKNLGRFLFPASHAEMLDFDRRARDYEGRIVALSAARDT